MKGLKFFLLFLGAPFLGTMVFAQSNLHQFMTSLDFLRDNSPSNIYLHNNRNSSATVYGLYVREFSYVTPGDTCNHATQIYSQNITAGAFLTPTTIGPGKSAALGMNYLYNMIYQAMYYVNIIIPSSPPGCALPGCTWGSDTLIYNWCIHLGALAPVTTSTGYTANVPPSTDSASSAGLYDYNLISNYVELGPISCDDQTLKCSVANSQAQSFS